MLSNYRIQDSKIRAMGGKRWNQKHLMKEQFGIAQRLEEYGMIETLCNYFNSYKLYLVNDGNEDEDDEYDNSGLISSILHTACNSKPNYSSAIRKEDPKRKGLFVNIKIADASQTELQVNIDSLEISGDMLKRQITQDDFIIQKLGLNDVERYGRRGVTAKSLTFGLMNDEGNFISFESSLSLLKVGIKNGNTILMIVDIQ